MARIYIRFLDRDDGETAAIKMVSDPPRAEWDEKNLTPAQVLALVAMGAALASGDLTELGEGDLEPVPTESPAKGIN